VPPPDYTLFVQEGDNTIYKNSATGGEADVDADKISWDGTNLILTLNGFDFTTTASDALIVPNAMMIVLNGENKIEGDSVGISGVVTFTGIGKIDIIGELTGLMCNSSVVNITGSAVVTANGGEFGVVCDILVAGGELYATGTLGNGICGNVLFTGGILVAEGGDQAINGGVETKVSGYRYIMGDGSNTTSYSAATDDISLGDNKYVKLTTERTTPLDLTSTSVDYEALSGPMTGINFNNTTIRTSVEGWIWNGAQKIFELHGMYIRTSSGTALTLPDGAIIELVNESVNMSITTNSGSSGIACNTGTFTITGDSGELTAIGNSSGISTNAAITLSGGTLTSIGNSAFGGVGYTVPAGYMYWTNSTRDPSPEDDFNIGNGTTTKIADGTGVKYARIKAVAAAETLGTLTVALTAGDGKVTLAAQTAATGFDFYYKNTAASQSASKPALDSTALTGWTKYTANADITGANGTEIFVQVVKVETSSSKIKAWGEDSATPALGAPVITITTQPAGNTTVTEGDISGSLTVAASVTQSKTLSYQWYKNSTNSNSGGTAESGSTSASFTIPTGLTKGTYYYYCVVSADGGAADVASSVAAVKVTGPPYKITFNRHDGFGGTAEITAYDGSPMPQITPPVLPGLTFKGYFSEEDGDGTKYYDKDGKSVHDGNSDHDELHANFE